MCEPDCIRYKSGASITCTDMNKAQEMVRRTYQSAVELFAFLCEKYQLNPLEDGTVISHREGHIRKIASGHYDPEHLWQGVSCGFTMDGFRRDVFAAMGKTELKKEIQIEVENKVQTKDKPQAKELNDIVEGCLVGLTEDAVYYSGKVIKDWIKKEQWIVASVCGDRAVLGNNKAGTHNIKSPVNIKYLVRKE